MIIKLTDNEIEILKEDFVKILSEKGFEITEINSNQWIIKNNEHNIDKLLFKSQEIFKNFGYRYDNNSPRPHYTIVDDANMTINFIFIRTQKGIGSVTQKLTAGNFIITDYIRAYPKIKEYDLFVSNVMTEFHSDQSLVELLKYLKGNSINVWINKVKV